MCVAAADFRKVKMVFSKVADIIRSEERGGVRAYDFKPVKVRPPPFLRPFQEILYRVPIYAVTLPAHRMGGNT